MIKKLYVWFHRLISASDEKEEYSAGFFPNLIRKKILNASQEYSGTILEVGCGEGLYLTKLAKINSALKIYGIDNYEENLLKLKYTCDKNNIKNIHAVFGDGTNLPFKNEIFDTVFAFNLLINIDSIETVQKIIEEMGRVCKTNGKIVFDIRNSLNPFFYFAYKLAKYYEPKADKLPFKTYKVKDIANILKKSNLIIARKIYIFPVFKAFAPIIIIEAKKP
ncbi:MAG: class I SAM-dependent methyltransferase [Candidatus Firestonebacteria bacterium]